MGSEELLPQSPASRLDVQANPSEDTDDIPPSGAGRSIPSATFFRDPALFEALGISVFPAMLRDRPARLPIRIWVPCCGAGEEVFSLAIRLIEALGESTSKTSVRVFATDVDESMIRRARSGLYAENAVADVSRERLSRFFVQEASGYRVHRMLRDLCVFARHDVKSDPPISGVDLISGRNILEDPTIPEQIRLLPIFHYALRDGGLLLLGSAKPTSTADMFFDAVEPASGLYAKRAGGASASEPVRGSSEPPEASKEALLMANRELFAVNEQLVRRNSESAQLIEDLTSLLSSVHIPMLLVSDDLVVRRSTPSAAEPFGLSPAGGECSIDNLKTKLVGIDLQSKVVALLQTGEPREEDVRDSSGHWHRLSIRPYFADQERPTGAVISLVDIDALKRSEQHIERARRYAEGIIATVQVPLLVLDAKLRVVSANESFYEAFRTSPADTEWRPLGELGSRQWSNPSLLGLIQDAVSRDKSFTGFLVEHDFIGLGRRRIMVNGKRLVRRGHEPPLVLVALEDVTERDRMEMQLRQAQKMEAIGQLAAGIAHDFNNLMTVINGCTCLLLEGSPLDASAREMVGDIASAGERAAALTRQLLAFSRKQMISPKRLDVNVVVAETERMLRRLIGEHIHLKTSVEAGLGRVVADPIVIQQALLNLAINSRDAMPYGGDLTIETHNIEVEEPLTPAQGEAIFPGSYVTLVVRDTGCGMSEEAVRRIFEPFFTTKEVGKGSGLGLPSVYGSIKQSGGFVDVDSSPGGGTTFTIYLPRLRGTLQSEPPGVDLNALPRGQETVLLVEDAPDVRKLTSRMLQMAGYTVLEAEGANVALAMARSHQGQIHLLVSDVVMPQTAGPKLAELLALDRKDTKVLLVSGYAEKTSLGAGFHPSGHPLLQKPYTPMTLLRRIREILDEEAVRS